MCVCVCVSVPAGVNAPTSVEVGTTYIALEWTRPTSPNGVLTGFMLKQSPGRTLYRGALTQYNVTSLHVRTYCS